VKSCSVCMPR